MTEETKSEPKVEKLEYTISPLERNIGVVFPEGTTEAEKKLFAMNLETARQQKRDIEIDPAIKFVPLRIEEPKSETPTTGAETTQPASTPTTGTQPIQQMPPVQPTQPKQPQTPVQPQVQTQPIQQPTQATQSVQPAQVQPTTQQATETVVTQNPVNPENTVTSTEKVQAQGQ